MHRAVKSLIVFLTIMFAFSLGQEAQAVPKKDGCPKASKSKKPRVRKKAKKKPRIVVIFPSTPSLPDHIDDISPMPSPSPAPLVVTSGPLPVRPEKAGSDGSDWLKWLMLLLAALVATLFLLLMAIFADRRKNRDVVYDRPVVTPPNPVAASPTHQVVVPPVSPQVTPARSVVVPPVSPQVAPAQPRITFAARQRGGRMARQQRAEQRSQIPRPIEVPEIDKGEEMVMQSAQDSLDSLQQQARPETYQPTHIGFGGEDVGAVEGHARQDDFDRKWRGEVLTVTPPAYLGLGATQKKDRPASQCCVECGQLLPAAPKHRNGASKKTDSVARA